MKHAPGAAAPAGGPIPLPAGYRIADLLDYHRRDPASPAEQVDAGVIRKGLLWHGRPALLVLQLEAGAARVELQVEAPAGATAGHALAALATRMLGLAQPVDAFEAAHREHPQLGPLLAARPGLRVPVAASPFEALSWAVTGQQISLAAAFSLRRRLIRLAGLPHASGLWCYPDASRVAALDTAQLRAAGFSAAKADTLLNLARASADGRLPLERWLDLPPAEEIRSRLLAFRGVGPWTADYTLLRGYAHLDGSLHGDAAVRRRLQILLQAPAPLPPRTVQHWLESFAPWRALAAAHLWAGPAPTARGP